MYTQEQKRSATKLWRIRNGDRIRAYARSYYHKHREKFIEKVKNRKKRDPVKVLAGQRRTYYKNWERNKEVRRAYRIRNKEKCKQLAEKWRKKNPERDYWLRRTILLERRARMKNASDGTVTRQALMHLVSSAIECCYCRKELGKTDRHVDHKHPISKGGLHGLDNLAVCCRSCNVRKNATPYDQWLLKCSQREAV